MRAVCDTARKVAFPVADVPPEQAADVFGLHFFPMLRIPPGNPGLRVSAVVVLECPIAAWAESAKALCFRFSTASTWRRCSSAACRCSRAALWQSHSAGVGGHGQTAPYPPGSRLLSAYGTFRSKAVRPRRYSPPSPGRGCHVLQNIFDFTCHKLSPSIQV